MMTTNFVARQGAYLSNIHADSPTHRIQLKLVNQQGEPGVTHNKKLFTESLQHTAQLETTDSPHKKSFRSIICAPLTSEAMKLMNTDDCPDLLLETLFLSEKDHCELLGSGVLETINKATGKLVDDYEDESIDTPEDLHTCLAILKDCLKNKNSPTVQKLIHLNSIAINNHTGLFFFF